MLNHHILPVTAFMQNCTLLWCDETREAALVDPGGEASRLLDEIARRGLVAKQLLLTHGHLTVTPPKCAARENRRSY